MAETRKVGSLEVSVAGLGCNNFGMRMDDARTKAVVDAALDAGVNNFDTADIYGGGKSEEFLGRALGSRRGEAVITTKVGGRGAPRAQRREPGVDQPGHRRQPAPARHRPHRPLPPAHARRRRPRSARRSRRSPSSSPRARCARSAARTSPAQMLEEAGRRGQGPGRAAVRERAERLQPARPLARSRGAPGLREPRHHAHALLPARERRAHRQVQARRAARPRARASRRGATAPRRCSPTRSSTPSIASRRTRRTTGTRCPSSRSRGSRARPTVGERDRRRDVAGAGAGERRGHERVAAHRRRARRGRRARQRRRLSMSGPGAAASPPSSSHPGPLADVGAPAVRGAGRVARRVARSIRRARCCSTRTRASAWPSRACPRRAGLRDPAALLAAFPAPTIAVWDGPAIGAGAELLLAADVRVVGRAGDDGVPGGRRR